MPIVQVRSRVERWQRPLCRRSGVHAAAWNSGNRGQRRGLRQRTRIKGCILAFERALFAIFRRGARHGFVRL